MARTLGEARRNAVALCRLLRRRQTEAESIFWNGVRNRRFDGLKFVRQYPFFHAENGSWSFYIADFYCHEKGLVVELDGGYHSGRQEYDLVRSAIIKAAGIRVVRFTNLEVQKDIRRVFDSLRKEFAER